MKKYIPSNNAKIADLGCGFGDFYKFLKNRNYNYIYRGYDINPEMIDYCKKKYCQCAGDCGGGNGSPCDCATDGRE